MSSTRRQRDAFGESLIRGTELEGRSGLFCMVITHPDGLGARRKSCHAHGSSRLPRSIELHPPGVDLLVVPARHKAYIEHVRQWRGDLKDSRLRSGLMGGLMGAAFATALVLTNAGTTGAIVLATFGLVLALGFGVMVLLKTWNMKRNKRESTAGPKMRG